MFENRQVTFIPSDVAAANSSSPISSFSPHKHDNYDGSLMPDSAISSRRESSITSHAMIQHQKDDTPRKTPELQQHINRRKKSLKPFKSPQLDSHSDQRTPGIVFKVNSNAGTSPISVVKGLLDYNLVLSKYRVSPSKAAPVLSVRPARSSNNSIGTRRASVPLIPKLREKRTRAGSFSTAPVNQLVLENNRIMTSSSSSPSFNKRKDEITTSTITTVDRLQTLNDEEDVNIEVDDINSDSLLSLDDDDDDDDDQDDDEIDDDTRSSSAFSMNKSTAIGRDSAIKANIELMTVSRRISAHRSVDGKQCAACTANKTPYWRDAWSEYLMLCNACGLRFQKFKLHCCKCNYVPRKEDYKSPKCPQCDGEWI